MRSFLQNHKNPKAEIFAFCDITFELIEGLNFRPIQHLKMTVLTSVLWRQKNWLEVVLKRPLVRYKFWLSVYVTNYRKTWRLICQIYEDLHKLFWNFKTSKPCTVNHGVKELFGHLQVVPKCQMFLILMK